MKSIEFNVVMSDNHNPYVEIKATLDSALSPDDVVNLFRQIQKIIPLQNELTANGEEDKESEIEELMQRFNKNNDKSELEQKLARRVLEFQVKRQKSAKQGIC